MCKTTFVLLAWLVMETFSFYDIAQNKAYYRYIKINDAVEMENNLPKYGVSYNGFSCFKYC